MILIKKDEKELAARRSPPETTLRIPKLTVECAEHAAGIAKSIVAAKLSAALGSTAALALETRVTRAEVMVAAAAGGFMAVVDRLLLSSAPTQASNCLCIQCCCEPRGAATSRWSIGCWSAALIRGLRRTIVAIPR